MPMSIAPRVMVKFPSGSTWASTNDWDGHLDLVVSRELEPAVRDARHGRRRAPRRPGRVPRVGRRHRGDSARASRAGRALRALVEWQGEFVIKDNTLLITPPYVAEDGSIAPLLSPISDPTNFKVGGVWQASNGLFVHAGVNYSFGTARPHRRRPRHRAQPVGLRRPPRLAPGRDAARASACA